MVASALLAGVLLCIFPERGITRDGELQPFKAGVMKLLEGRPDIPVVPMALLNLWGSFFSRIERGEAMVKPFRRGMFNRIALVAGEPLPALAASPETLRTQVAQLLTREH